MDKNISLNQLLHGGDYNPEQWLEYPDILEKDIEYMKMAHINTVSLGMFSWSMLEPEEGQYQFGWLEEQIERLYQNGISVILATPSGARPKWLADQYPEVLRVEQDRHRNYFGFRHNHCYTSPVYRDKIRSMNVKLAEKFGNHPAVIAWHVSNEYGGECHCPLCQEQFREWLEARYTTIKRLNDCWQTTFWSHTYQNFSQIESPGERGETSLHGLNLDWKRFVTDRTVDFAKWEIQALRDGGSQKPTTINMMYDYKGLNYHKFADVVDIISWDTYPTWHKGREYLTAMDNGMQHDNMRSLQKKPFLLMESCPSSTNWQSVSKLKRPGMLHAASMQAIAHGSDSVMYFQIRQSRGSYEKFHGAVINHYGGADTRVFREVTQVGESLKLLREVKGTYVKSKAAVLYDWENRWAMEDAAGPRNRNLYYKECVEKSYSALRSYGLDVDVLDMEQPLQEYQVIAAPMLYMFRNGIAKQLREFIAGGGILFMTYWSGIVDESDLCYLGEIPHDLTDVLGIRSEEMDGLYDNEENLAVPVEENLLGISNRYTCKNLCDLIQVKSAVSLMNYGTDFYQGTPVLTCNSYGKGKAYYIGADMEAQFYMDIYKKALQLEGITGLLPGAEIPQGVEVTSRESERYGYVFIQNFNPTEVDVDVSLVGDVILGSQDSRIESYGTKVIRISKGI